jgi:hypothetical protein
MLFNLNGFNYTIDDDGRYTLKEDLVYLLENAFVWYAYEYYISGTKYFILITDLLVFYL